LPKENFIVDTERVDDEFAWKASKQKIAELEMGKLGRDKGL
jgi:hypothetical protein